MSPGRSKPKAEKCFNTYIDKETNEIVREVITVSYEWCHGKCYRLEKKAITRYPCDPKGISDVIEAKKSSSSSQTSKISPDVSEESLRSRRTISEKNRSERKKFKTTDKAKETKDKKAKKKHERKKANTKKPKIEVEISPKSQPAGLSSDKQKKRARESTRTSRIHRTTYRPFLRCCRSSPPFSRITKCVPAACTARTRCLSHEKRRCPCHRCMYKCHVQSCVDSRGVRQCLVCKPVCFPGADSAQKGYEKVTACVCSPLLCCPRQDTVKTACCRRPCDNVPILPCGAGTLRRGCFSVKDACGNIKSAMQNSCEEEQLRSNMAANMCSRGPAGGDSCSPCNLAFSSCDPNFGQCLRELVTVVAQMRQTMDCLIAMVRH